VWRVRSEYVLARALVHWYIFTDLDGVPAIANRRLLKRRFSAVYQALDIGSFIDCL
jgi:hypothetical protein